MKRLLSAALFIAALVSCGQTREIETENIVQGSKTITITATIGDGTRTTLGGRSVVWEEGDQILLTQPPFGNADIFTIVPEDAGKTTARFTGKYYFTEESGVSMFAIYPASAHYKREYAYFLTVDVPEVQNYKENSFGRGANISFAQISDTTVPIVFYNSGGLLKLTIKGSASVDRIELESENPNDFLSGIAAMSQEFPTDPEHNYNFVFLNSDHYANPKLTLDCEGGVALSETGTDFYFYVPYDKLGNGFSVTIYDTDGNYMKKKAPASEKNCIVRNEIKAMPAFTYEADPAGKFKQIMIPGEYRDCLSSNPVIEKSYISSKLQTGVTKDDSKQTFSLKNWSDEYVVEYRFPLNMVEGTSYDISVVPVLGNSGVTAQTLNLKFLGSEKGIGWFADEDTGKGYILNVI